MLLSVKIGVQLMTKPKECFKCKKLAVIIKDKIYYCAVCYLLKEGIKPLDQINDFNKNFKKD